MAEQLWAATNVVGPNGETVFANEPIPDDWPAELRESLLATGGATDIEPAPTPEEI